MYMSSREFTHRVKSISMAKFTAEEVSALRAGGNEVCVMLNHYFVNFHNDMFYFVCSLQRARKIYFKEWDTKRDAYPDARFLHILLI